MFFSAQTTANTQKRQLRVLRSKYEILSLLAEMADVRGIIELEVNVTADRARAEILIRAEDKVQFLFGHNPELQTLRTALDLDIE